MTKLELALAHQATLWYIHTNDLVCDPQDLINFLNPSTKQGLCLLRTIARNVGRVIDANDAEEIARYL